MYKHLSWFVAFVVTTFLHLLCFVTFVARLQNKGVVFYEAMIEPVTDVLSDFFEGGRMVFTTTYWHGERINEGKFSIRHCFFVFNNAE